MIEPQDELVYFVVVTGISFLPHGNEDIFNGGNRQRTLGRIAARATGVTECDHNTILCRFPFRIHLEITSHCYRIVSSIPLKVHGFGKYSLNTTGGWRLLSSLQCTDHYHRCRGHCGFVMKRRKNADEQFIIYIGQCEVCFFCNTRAPGSLAFNLCHLHNPTFQGIYRCEHLPS